MKVFRKDLRMINYLLPIIYFLKPFSNINLEIEFIISITTQTQYNVMCVEVSPRQFARIGKLTYIIRGL